MAAPLSIDLRKRIIAATHANTHTLRELAQLFFVNLSTIVRLLQQYRRTGSIVPKPHGGGHPPALDAQAETRLLELVKKHPDATLEELRDRLGIPCSIGALFRALQRNGITRKKKTYHADEQKKPQVQQQRQEFQERLATVDPNHLVFVDETGATTAMGRTYGRAPAGERVQASAPGTWKNVTLLSGLRTSGVVAPMAVPGSTDGPVFETYVEKVLGPELHPGDVVVWDNLKPHKSPVAEAAIKAAGARLEPLPVYSPDLSPIEEMFSKVKGGLRTIAARTVDTVINGMGKVLNTVNKTDILGWFNDRCSYAMQA
jgi:transposase